MSYTVGDKGTKLSGTCSDNGTDVDISGTGVQLQFLVPGGSVFTRSATISDGPTGKWEYTWATGDLTAAGDWRVEVVVTGSGGAVVQTFGPAHFQVEPLISG